MTTPQRIPTTSECNEAFLRGWAHNTFRKDEEPPYKPGDAAYTYFLDGQNQQAHGHFSLADALADADENEADE